MSQTPLKDGSHLYETMRAVDHAVRPGFGVHEMELAPDQTVPWHSHSNISDTFYVISGRLRLHLREPDETIDLSPTHSYRVAPLRPHLVTNAGDTPVTLLVLQGIGTYDYIPLDETISRE